MYHLLASLLTIHVGTSTIFGNGDGQAASSWACRYAARRTTQTVLSRNLERLGHVFASRDLPCWTVALVCTDRSCALGTVADYGPRKPRLVDFWHVLARALGHNGLERVWMVAL